MFGYANKISVPPLFAAAALLSFSHSAQACPTWHNLSNGTTADATQVMDNFNSILQCPAFSGNVLVGTGAASRTVDIISSSGDTVAGNDAIRITTSGSSGYGSQLVVNSTTITGGRSFALISSGNSDPYGAGKFVIQDNSASGAARLIIDSSGLVGIGTTSPDAKLSMSDGNLHIGNSNITNQSNLLFDRGAAASIGAAQSSIGYIHDGGLPGNNEALVFNVASGGDYRFKVSGTDRFDIASNGNIGIGTTSPSYLLHVNGTAYATGAAGALSDVRHKKNVAPLKDGALATVMSLHPVTFEWREPKDDGMTGKQTGFIAQEVEKVLPSVVLTQNDAAKTKGLKYNELIPVLTKALQEQQEEIQTLKAIADRYEKETQELRRSVKNYAVSSTDLQMRLARLETPQAHATRKELTAAQ